jgi:outer membrane protein OmpA-like peptidoglycan-associated protein
MEFALCLLLGTGYMVCGSPYGVCRWYVTQDVPPKVSEHLMNIPERDVPADSPDERTPDNLFVGESLTHSEPDTPSPASEAEGPALSGGAALTPPHRHIVIGNGKPAIIWFGFGVKSLPDKPPPATAQILDAVVQTVEKYPDSRIEISGHSDMVGSERSKDYVSLQRAKRIEALISEKLTEKGITGYEITAAGYGSDNPLDSGNGYFANAKNRRVEIRILTP